AAAAALVGGAWVLGGVRCGHGFGFAGKPSPSLTYTPRETQSGQTACSSLAPGTYFIRSSYVMVVSSAPQRSQANHGCLVLLVFMASSPTSLSDAWSLWLRAHTLSTIA